MMMLTFGIPTNLNYKKAHRLKSIFFWKKNIGKKKLHKIFLKSQKEQINFFSAKFCEYYLKSVTAGQFSVNQIEVIRRTIKRTFKKNVHLKINIVPYVHLTKKPISARMGKGKGKPIKWVAPVSKNFVLSEFIILKKKQNLPLKKLKLSLKALKNKLSVKLKICQVLY